MRIRSDYPAPSYRDIHDRRFVSLIRHSLYARKGSINILGAPFDGATLGRKGSSSAPSAIRDALRFNSTYNPELGLSLEHARIFDLGDILLDSADVIASHAAIKDEVQNCIKPGSLLIILGGDNSISLPSILALASTFDKIGLIVLDSHYDLRGLIKGKPSSGSSYYLAIKALGDRLKGRVAYIGQHGFLNSSYYAIRAKKLGIKVFTPQDILNEGAYRIAKMAYSIASEGANCVYLSIDLDSIGIGEVSGVSAPSPSGLLSRDLFSLCTILASTDKLIAADLVETSPPLDPTGRSQIIAATAVCYLAAGFELRKIRNLVHS